MFRGQEAAREGKDAGATPDGDRAAPRDGTGAVARATQSDQGMAVARARSSAGQRVALRSWRGRPSKVLRAAIEFSL
ncbi:hypothetical protein JCM16408A_43620 [Methylobacterium phyllosphaerae]